MTEIPLAELLIQTSITALRQLTDEAYSTVPDMLTELANDGGRHLIFLKPKVGGEFRDMPLDLEMKLKKQGYKVRNEEYTCNITF